MTKKYFNPYTDFGFKKLFGEEGSKDLLMDFLNQLLPDYHQIAEISHLSANQYEQYQKSLIQYWDVKNATDTAFKDGKLEGKIEGKIEGELEKATKIAKNLLLMGLDIKAIAQATGLTEREIENLTEENF